MRRLIALTIVIVAACKSTAPAPSAPATPAAPPSATKAVADPLAPSDVPSLAGYAAFSDDNLAFAIAEPSAGAGLVLVTIYSVPTGSIERRTPLDSDDMKRQVAAQLLEDGFPQPGTPHSLPPGLSVAVDEGLVRVTVAGRPAARPYNPFENGTPRSATILAASADGSIAAVRTMATNGAGEFGPMTDIRFVKLFE